MGPANPTLARFIQKSIVNFARFGTPDPDDADTWPMYESDTRQVMNLGKPGQTEQDFSHGMGPDLLDREKCAFWQDAPYYVAGEGGDGDGDGKDGREGGWYKEGLR